MKKTILLLGLSAIVLGAELKMPFNVGVDVELGIKDSLKVKYLNETKFDKNAKIFNHKVSLDHENLVFDLRVNSKSVIENIGFDLNARINKKNYELANVFSYDFINSNYQINNINLNKYDMLFKDEIKMKYKNDNFEFSISPFLSYYMKNNEKRKSVSIINRKDSIKEKHIRLHFDKELGSKKDIEEKSRGLWLWGYVENPSDASNEGYPKNKMKFLLDQNDEYGQYLDIKKRLSDCGNDDNNCKEKRIGYIVVDGEKDESGSEKYIVKDNSEIIVINDYQNEVWIKLENKDNNVKAWNYYNYNPDYINNEKFKYLKKYHNLRKEFFENEEVIERTEKYKYVAGAKQPDYIKREKLLNDIKTLRNDLSNILNYGVNINFLYKGIENLSLSSGLKVQNYNFLDTKDNKWFVDLNLNTKYQYTKNKFSVIPSLNANLSFIDIQKANTKQELILNPKLELSYAFKENVSISTSLETDHIFNNEKTNFKYIETILKPSIKIKYIY